MHGNVSVCSVEVTQPNEGRIPNTRRPPTNVTRCVKKRRKAADCSAFSLCVVIDSCMGLGHLKYSALGDERLNCACRGILWAG